MRWNRIFCRPNVRKGLFLLVCSPAQWAANIPITIAGSTETQIAISFMPTSSGPCTITATDNNDGPVVADLDAAKFANAANDTGRTIGNGFRWPTLTNGPSRTVFIGGHDEIKQGLDGRWYSTSLQVNTDHTITVTCNGGADSGTIHASTSNLPVASYYPEMPIPTPGNPLGGMPQPTIDYSVPNYKVNDPVTGVLIQTVSQGTDNINDNEPRAAYWARDVVDVNGGAWTNAGNFITKRDSGNLATTSTANAPLFAAFAANWPDEWYTDLTVVPYGNAIGNTVISQWCLSTDSGQSCANYAPLDVMFSDSPTRAYRTIPSATPSSMFSGWGGMRVAYGTYDLVNRQVTGVSTSGHLVTATVAMAALGFNLDRVQGSKFKLSSCSTGSGGVFTVDHTDSEGQITMVESATNTGCTYTDMASGVRVILKNSGTLNVSLTAWEWGARGAYSGTNGARWICARQKVNDTQTGCAGETHSPAIGGYLCGLGNQGIYVIQDDGKMCLQSDLYSLNTAPQYHLAPELSGEISPIDARSFLLQAAGQTSVIGHTVKMTHIANNYEAVPVDPTHTANDRFTYTDLTATTTPIAMQIAKAGGEVARALGTGLWTPMGFDTVLDNGSGGATIQYRTQQGQDTPCMLAWADAASNVLLSTQPMYGGYPFSYAACHFSSQGAAGYSLVGAEAESSQLSPIFFNPSILLGGPFISRVTKVKKNGRFVDWGLSISGATNASPTVLTSTSSDIDQVNAANASQGALMTCSGGTGGWAALNRSFYAHYVSANTFSLYTDPLGASALDSSAFGSFSRQSITCKVAPPVYSINVSSISNNGGNARFTADTSYFAPFYPSGKLPMADRDPVAVNHGTMTSTTQYYAKVSSAPSGQFDLYTDAGLTSPVSFAAASRLGWGNGWGVTLAETCPDPATITLPGPMYMDTGFGTTGAGNQKVRCLWLRLNGEFCSDFPKTGEIAGYPCPGGGVHASQSMMHQIKVGDGLMSLRSSGNNHEISYVLQVDRSAGENQVDILVMRDYGDDPGYIWRGTTNGLNTDHYALQHSAGWTAWAAAVIPGGLVNTNVSPNTFAIPPVNGVHNDFVPGQTTGNVSQASGYAPHIADSRINVPIRTFVSPDTTAHSSMPFFSGSASYSLMTLQQSYPSLRWRGDQTPSSEQVWHGDWMAMNAGFGYGQNNGDGTGLTSRLQNIRGTKYDLGSNTTMVYKIPVQSAVNQKIAPLLVTAAPHVLFVDKSGPGSLITDFDIGERCTAFVAGECRPNSVAGDTFVAGRGWYTAYGQCIANTSTLGSPCAFGLWPGAGWAVQVRDAPVDLNNTGVRRLTLGFWTPPNHYSFSNWVVTPDAKWGIFVPNSVQQRAGAGQWFAMKLPPWPASADNTNRTTFVPVPIRFPASPGASIRIAFGYAEDGDPANLYCTTRHETCWTSAAATAANPYVFAREAQHKVACDSGCTVSVPAIPGRILFYQVEHTNGSRTVTDPLEAIALR